MYLNFFFFLEGFNLVSIIFGVWIFIKCLLFRNLDMLTLLSGIIQYPKFLS